MAIAAVIVANLLNVFISFPLVGATKLTNSNGICFGNIRESSTFFDLQRCWRKSDFRSIVYSFSPRIP
jgi:hypothetical protein